MQLICFFKVFLKGDFKNMSLTQKEKDDVIAFFSGLGVKNSQAEEILVNSFIKTFLECEAEKNKLYKKYYSTYLKIGFSVGFMLFLLVI